MTPAPAPGRAAATKEPAGARAVATTDSRLATLRTPGADILATASVRKRIVAVRLIWPGGSFAETAATAGTEAVATEALLLATASGASEPIAQRLEKLGITVTAVAERHCCGLDLRGPRDGIHTGLRLLAEVLAAPMAGPDAFHAARAAVRHQMERRSREIRTIAVDGLRAARTGDASAFARPAQGTAASLDAMTHADVVAVAAALCRRARFRVVVAGDPDPGEYAPDLAVLTGPPEPGGWPADPGFAVRTASAARISGSSREQAYLLWGVLVPIDGPGDHIVLELATHMLGGWAGSRWNVLLRDKLGYTYGTIASTTSMRAGGRLWCLAHVGMSVTRHAVAEAIDLVQEQAAGFAATGAGPEELDQAAVRLLRSEAHFHDSTRNLMARTASFLQTGLDADFAQRRMLSLRTVDATRFGERVRALLADPTLVVVADPATAADVRGVTE